MVLPDLRKGLLLWWLLPFDKETGSRDSSLRYVVCSADQAHVRAYPRSSGAREIVAALENRDGGRVSSMVGAVEEGVGVRSQVYLTFHRTVELWEWHDRLGLVSLIGTCPWALAVALMGQQYCR